MKNSFSIFELILTIIVSSIIVIYSSLYIKELFISNQKTKNIQMAKLNLLNTKIFLQKNKNSINSLKYENKNLYFNKSLLLKNVPTFNININGNSIHIEINYKNIIKQKWLI